MRKPTEDKKRLWGNPEVSETTSFFLFFCCKQNQNLCEDKMKIPVSQQSEASRRFIGLTFTFIVLSLSVCVSECPEWSDLENVGAAQVPDHKCWSCLTFKSDILLCGWTPRTDEHTACCLFHDSINNYITITQLDSQKNFLPFKCLFLDSVHSTRCFEPKNTSEISEETKSNYFQSSNEQRKNKTRK